jgi:hypothetical protein
LGYQRGKFTTDLEQVEDWAREKELEPDWELDESPASSFDGG